jgi:alcohol dehydrogenase class IV
MTLTSAGLGAVHGFAAPLGARFPVPHGTVCAALLPHVIRENVSALRAQAPSHPVLGRYATVGRLVGRNPHAEEHEAIDLAISQTASLARDMSIPPLGKFGVAQAAIPELIALARKASSMRYNPVQLSDEALSRILVDAGAT